MTSFFILLFIQNTNIVANQMIEGEDIKILYQQQIGGGGGGDIFDTAVMMKGSFKPIRQVVKKVLYLLGGIFIMTSFTNRLPLCELLQTFIP